MIFFKIYVDLPLRLRTANINLWKSDNNVSKNDEVLNFFRWLGYSKLNLSTFDFQNFCSMQFFNQCTEIVNSAKKSRSLLRELSVKIIH